MPKVSIIITCYNLGAYLDEALDSALAQTYPDLEVILVDDGSTDPLTLEVIDRVQNRPQVCLLRLENGGLARARNLGITAAIGCYILPLDADDRIHPEYVAKAAGVLDTHPGVGFAGCHYRSFGWYNLEFTPADYTLPALLTENLVPVCSLFRKKCWEAAGGYFENIRGYEDWDLWITILEQGYSGYVIPEILFEYRTRKGSMLSETKQPEVHVQRMETLYNRHWQSFEQHMFEVLKDRDKMFAGLLADRNWYQEQLTLIRQQQPWISPILWWHRQNWRWQRIMKENRTARARIRALWSGFVRVLANLRQV